MRQLNGVYTRRFNIRHSRVGHLYQGRYKSILVEKEAHLLSLCRYIVNNPVAAGMVDDVSEWNWSSYQATAGLMGKLKLLTTEWVLEQFGGSADRYRQYIVQAEMTESPLSDACKSNVLGSEKFRKVVQQQIKAVAEVPKAQLYVAKRPLCELENDSTERGEWMTNAYQEHGYTMREIASYAKVHYSLISKLIKAWEKR